MIYWVSEETDAYYINWKLSQIGYLKLFAVEVKFSVKMRYCSYTGP